MKKHGFRIRPDIIIHLPFEQSGYSSRDEGNLMVIELKQQATEKEALADYRRLFSMCRVLGYPLGIFINIVSDETFFGSCQGAMKARLHSCGVCLAGCKAL